MRAVTIDPDNPSPSARPAGTARRQVRYPCHTVDPDLFFAEMPADVEVAKTLCRTCPVRLGCLAAALRRAEPWGVWGGELLIDGQIRPSKRGRGRPRKLPAAA
jgi:WhiB family transcriptional regulator, redox-sensing transcriptional regulator